MAKQDDKFARISKLAGMSVSAFGAAFQGISEYGNLSYSAIQAEQNAIQAELAAIEARAAGGRESRKHRQRVNQFMGEQRTAYAASGVGVDTGAPVEILDETRRHGLEDESTIRRNAILESWGMKSKAEASRLQARQYRSAAKSAMVSGMIGAGTTLLTGVAEYGMLKKRGYFVKVN